jgi:hypothetical protein
VCATRPTTIPRVSDRPAGRWNQIVEVAHHIVTDGFIDVATWLARHWPDFNVAAARAPAEGAGTSSGNDIAEWLTAAAGR